MYEKRCKRVISRRNQCPVLCHATDKANKMKTEKWSFDWASCEILDDLNNSREGWKV